MKHFAVRIRRQSHSGVSARPLKRVIQRSLLDPLSLEILGGRFREGDSITAERQMGGLGLRCKCGFAGNARSAQKKSLSS